MLERVQEAIESKKDPREAAEAVIEVFTKGAGATYVNAPVGLTLRDHFAAQALIPLVEHGLNNPQMHDDLAKEHNEAPAEFRAALAYVYADAMLAERTK